MAPRTFDNGQPVLWHPRVRGGVLDVPGTIAGRIQEGFTVRYSVKLSYPIQFNGEQYRRGQLVEATAGELT